MLIANELWSDEWFCSLEQRFKLLYIYLLGNCSKCGIFELNIRKINFDLSNGIESLKPYTTDEVLTFAGKRIRKINDNKAIIALYIYYNWFRGNPLDPSRNPLHKGLLQELKKYGLDFARLNEMANKKFTWKENGNDNTPADNHHTDNAVSGLIANDLAEEMFTEFWNEYPSSCPRKVDKKKCLAKYQVLLKNAGAKYAELHAKIIAGVRLWKQSEMWNSNGGQYIKGPLVFLNSENWNDNPMKGNGNAVNRQCAKTADNYIGGTVAEADQF